MGYISMSRAGSPLTKIRDVQLIPNLTDFNHPIGTVTHSDQYSTYYSWNAFRDVPSRSKGAYSATKADSWVEWKMKNASCKMVLKKAVIHQSTEYTGEVFTKFKLQAITPTGAIVDITDEITSSVDEQKAGHVITEITPVDAIGYRIQGIEKAKTRATLSGCKFYGDLTMYKPSEFAGLLFAPMN